MLFFKWEVGSKSLHRGLYVSTVAFAISMLHFDCKFLYGRHETAFPTRMMQRDTNVDTYRVK